MKSTSHQKYIGVIMSHSMRNELHPITKNYPLGLLSVANKKLIIYQLQQLQSISQLSAIIIIYSMESIKVKQYIETNFLPNHPSYPHHINFICINYNTSQYACLQYIVQSSLPEIQQLQLESAKGLIIAPLDLISSIKYSCVFNYHIENRSDLTMLLKQKKQYTKEQKKPDYQIQNNIDIVMSGYQNGQVFALRSLQNYEYSGFVLNKSTYSQVGRAKIQKAVDTKLYIFSNRIIKIIKNLVSTQLSHLKIDFIDLLIRNRSNSNLLCYVSETQVKPLRIFHKNAGQNEYIRRIDTVKIFESLNLDSLIRGPKQKQITMPNKYTLPIDQTMMAEFRGTLIGTLCEIDVGSKITRNVIENACKIGKNVDINNSIIMTGTTIEDGCKISNCIIGPNCHIKMQASLNLCQLAMNCVVEKGTANQKQIMLPLV